ncbi:MAG: hypothetical protein J3R72DRAFT_463428, partial [Linnemannia gamsii]
MSIRLLFLLLLLLLLLLGLVLCLLYSSSSSSNLSSSSLLLGLGLGLSSLLLIHLHRHQTILVCPRQLIHLAHQFLDSRDITPLPLPDLLKRLYLGSIRQHDSSKPIPDIRQLSWRNRIKGLEQPQETFVDRLNQVFQFLVTLTNACRVLTESKFRTTFPYKFLLRLLDILSQVLLILLANQPQTWQMNMRISWVNRMLSQSLCPDLSETNILVEKCLQVGFDFLERMTKFLLEGTEGAEVFCSTVILDQEVGYGADGGEGED